MANSFNKIGLFSKINQSLQPTLEEIVTVLQKLKKAIYIETTTSTLVKGQYTSLNLEQLVEEVDLLIVVGGDGSMLKAARAATHCNLPLVGVNRGKLGFLADINPEDSEAKLSAILAGDYIKEHRVLLQSEIIRDNTVLSHNLALNDIVLYNGNLARIVEFAVYINDDLMQTLNADGIIVATPTGSTAYALSGGGPILAPSVNAFSLVPMFPHTLSSRPIVVNDDVTIKLVLINPETNLNLSCDGQVHHLLKPHDIVNIQKAQSPITLLHPNDYNYFRVLRHKLGLSDVKFPKN